MPTHQKILQTLRNYSPYFLWMVGILIVFVNLWVASKLNPINQNLEVIASQVEILQKELNENTEAHDKYVTKDTFEQVTVRLNSISNRVDQIYSIVATKK